MMAANRDTSSDFLARAAYGAILASVILGALIYGRDVLIPVILAVLLSFVLSPLVNQLRPYLHRGVAVALVVVATVAAVSALGFAMARQVIELGGELPKYEMTLHQKLKIFQTGSAQTRVIDKATSVLKGLSQELEQQTPRADAQSPDAQQRPVPVEIRQPPDRPLDIYQRILTALLGPVTTTGIVLILVVFILFQKTDIRDRVIRLAGTRDIQVTTAALNDAAERLSRLFLMQTALNTVFGAAIAMGLWLIGVPSPILWGVFSALMRFVPYIGSILSAIFPILLAASVDPGWTMVVETAALFLVLEPLVGNLIEPWLQGHSTGLSPLAIVMSALLWTTLWGPIGLLIATPITMCLVVLGRHIDGLSFLNVILGDEPVLSPVQTFYQRLLSGSYIEATEHAEGYLKKRSLLQYTDNVALPGLMLAARDATRGALDQERMDEIHDGLVVLLDELGDRSSETETQEAKDGARDDDLPDHTKRDLASLRSVLDPSNPVVMCVGARIPIDASAAHLLSFVFNQQGIPSRAAAVNRLIDLNNLDLEGIQLLWLTATDIAAEQSHIRYVLRRLRRIRPELVVLGAFWRDDEDAGSIDVALDVSRSAGNIREAIQYTVEIMRDRAQEELSSGDAKKFASEIGDRA